MDHEIKDRLPASFRVLIDTLITWWDAWISMWFIGLLWALSWLTIVFGPPATFGMAYVAFRLSRGESLGMRGMLEGGRRYFVKSWLWMFLYVVVLFLLLINIFFYQGVTAVWGNWLFYIMILLAVLWILTQFLALGYLMEHENESIRLALRNGLFTIIAAPGFSAILTVVLAGIAFLTIQYYVPILVGGPTFLAVLRAVAVRNRLSAYGAYTTDDHST